MGKGKPRPPQYVRQSKGYQQNMYKNQLKEKNVEMPKQVDTEKMMKINKIIAIALIILTVILLFFNWKAALVCALIGVAYAVGFFLYINNLSKKYIKAYKAMGVTKDMYIKQLRKSGTDVKNIERMSKIWDKTKAD